MTNSVTVQERGNAGDHDYVIAEVDITSLASAGTESFDAASVLGLDGVQGAEVLDRENRRYHFEYDADNTQILVWDNGPEMNQRSVDPSSQTYGGSSDTTLATYNPGGQSRLVPLNFNPADPSDANLSVILRAEFHDGTTTDLVSIADGSEQTYENLVDGFATADDGLSVNKLLVVVNNSGSDVTEDIGATTTEFWAYGADAENNEDVGTVTMRFEGDYGP